MSDRETSLEIDPFEIFRDFSYVEMKVRFIKMYKTKIKQLQKFFLSDVK